MCDRRNRRATLALSFLCAGLFLLPQGASAARGLASTSAATLWVAAAETTLQAEGAPAAKAIRTGLWLDVDHGARDEQHGLTWGARLGWTGVGSTLSDAFSASSVGGAARIGVARGMFAWNAGWAGEFLLSADLWSAYDQSTWYTTGLRMAPRVGFRVLLGYGSAVRARLRVDIAPALFVATNSGEDSELSGLWARLGFDMGPVTVGGWGHVIAGQQHVGGAWRPTRDVSAGISVGLRMGRGGDR